MKIFYHIGHLYANIKGAIAAEGIQPADWSGLTVFLLNSIIVFRIFGH